MDKEITLHTHNDILSISLCCSFIISFSVSYLSHHPTDGVCLDPILIHLPVFALLLPLLAIEARSTVLHTWGALLSVVSGVLSENIAHACGHFHGLMISRIPMKNEVCSMKWVHVQ